MTECRYRVPKEAVEIFRTPPDTALRDLLQPSLLRAGWDWASPELPADLTCCWDAVVL